jgi:hypothetical protein
MADAAPVMRQRVRDLLKQGDGMFSTRTPILSLWQTIAENFHVMRADFTPQRYMSEEFGSYLMTGRPAMAHRDLQNSLPAMLRPRGEQWFKQRTGSKRINDKVDCRQWLDWASETQYRAMYARQAKFVRSTKECDGDYSAFGNGVLTCEPNQVRDGLLIRCWHLRDTVWAENAELEIDRVNRNWNPEAHVLGGLFEKMLHQSVSTAVKEEPFKKISCRHLIIAASDYDMPRAQTKDRKWVSIYVDRENETILEEKSVRVNPYIIPRWATVSGSPIAYSPAAVYGLPDARMLQQITLTILEAGQKVVDPPMIAVGEAINGGVNTAAGMVTWTDADYDERMGEVLRPITLKPEGLAFGAQREERIEKMIDNAFFLNQIRMPTVTKEMTADETERVYEEYMRQALPLLEPIEEEYSGGICETAFEQLRDMGAFGSVYDMPQELRGADIKWEFDSPLQAAKDKLKVGKFQQALQIVIGAMQVNPDAGDNFDLDKGVRDGLMAADGADWIVDEKQRDTVRQNKAQQAAAAAAAAQVAQGADAATRVAGAVSSGQDAMQKMQGAGFSGVG